MNVHKTTSKKAVLWISLLVIVALLGIAFFSLNKGYKQVLQYDQHLRKNIFIEGIAVGDMTPDAALHHLETTLLPTLDNRTIELVGKGNTIPLTYKELGVTYNLSKVVEDASLIGHEGNLWERYKAMKEVDPAPIHLTLTPSYDETVVTALVTDKLQPFYKAPVDAKMVRKNRSFHITSEVIGQKADISTAITDTLSLLDSQATGTVEVALLPIPPKYTAALLKECQTPLSSFYTTYNDADPNRNTNLALATNKINTVIMPGEKFKYSNQIEPITEAAGFKNSKVIVNGALAEGIGGGICQVSSTLYNALILTDIDIYMRRNHSLPVSYTPLGRDATYATDSVDFQFINNTGYPLYLESYCENNKVYVNLFGHKSFKPGYESKFESVVTETLKPPAPKYEDDPTLAVGTQIQKVRPKEGHKVVLYKLYYQNGQLIKKEKLNTSIYKPQQEVIRRGTKPA